MELRGIYVPHITPFKEDQSIDYDALRACIDFWIEGGLSGLVTLGSNGEFPYLMRSERRDLIKHVIDYVNGRVQVIVGTGAPSTIETIELSKEAVDLGADAVMIAPPYYFKVSSEELLSHYSAILDEIDAPVILYDVPKFVGYSIEVDVFEKLVKEYSQIIGVKDSSNNILHIAELIRRIGDKISIMAGTSRVILPTLVLGGKGAIVAVANFMPKEVVRLYQSFIEGNIDEARKIQFLINEVDMLMKKYNQIAVVKAIVNLIGKPGGLPRKPILPLKKDELDDVKSYLVKCGLLRKYSR